MMMKRRKFDTLGSPSRLRLIQVLFLVLFVYFLFMSFEIPRMFRTGLGSITDELPRPPFRVGEEEKDTPILPSNVTFRVSQRLVNRTLGRQMREFKKVSDLMFDESVFDGISKDGSSELHKSAKDAWVEGKKLWDELESGKLRLDTKKKAKNQSESCPNSIALSGSQFWDRGSILVLPCGLTLGSHITLVGKPHLAHPEYDPKISSLKEGDESVMVSQFMMELQGLKTVDGEDPPRIIHFNPRLKGDWSGKPVIEQNTCYRMQWGSAVRCEGWKSTADEETGR